VSDVREAIDFCRYYALLAMNATGTPLGVVATISPWNFPLAIFTGQVAASLAAGNTVIAKPAEQTPRIAQQAVALAYEAGISPDALQLALGDGKVGAQLVADDRVRGVMFTGSLQVAKLIERTLHLRSGAQEIPFIAETSGLNAMIVDSTALIDQAVNDVVASAFDSAGQRCSALRLLWLQADIADRFIAALKGAMAELRVGDPSLLATDIGPVIDAEAHARLERQVARLEREAKLVARVAMPGEIAHFNTTLPYFAPCAYEIKDLQPVQEETFGPILHIRRFKASEAAQVVRDTAALGYALTFGVHTRLASRIATLAREAPAGNVYINRNIIGAVVGSQPFGGGRKSGTGPKAGGPWALRRLQHGGEARVASLGIEQMPLPGVTGERNTWSIEPRGLVACAGPTAADVKDQLEDIAQFGLAGIDASQDKAILKRSDIGAVLCAQWNGAYSADIAAAREDILPIVAKSSTGYDITRLYEERVVSNNVAAAGGDVALLTQ
jgi:RHH-type proline utilization regulon transcriptional repressor/proline dehydrogenase/delta 1-pyrroline-5-carboxylate dehydrogenase